jgi:hypothetical protein
MEMASVLFLIACYMGIGLIFSFYYSSYNVEEWGSEFFYGLFGNWCDKNNVSYVLLMVVYSIFLWPTFLLTMAHSVMYVIQKALTELIVGLYRLCVAIKKTVMN